MVQEDIEVEFNKLIDCSFIYNEQYPQCPANIIPVMKNTVRFVFALTFKCYVNICNFKCMYVMDGFSNYNQIKMDPDDEKHISLPIP